MFSASVRLFDAYRNDEGRGGRLRIFVSEADLDGTGQAVEVGQVTGVGPVFGVSDEAPGDGVAVDVPDLFDSLGLREDVEVVVAVLPEGSVCCLLADGELQGWLNLTQEKDHRTGGLVEVRGQRCTRTYEYHSA